MEPLPTVERAGVGQEGVFVTQDCGPRPPGEETAGHRDRLAPRLEQWEEEE